MAAFQSREGKYKYETDKLNAQRASSSAQFRIVLEWHESLLTSKWPRSSVGGVNHAGSDLFKSDFGPFIYYCHSGCRSLKKTPTYGMSRDLRSSLWSLGGSRSTRRAAMLTPDWKTGNCCCQSCVEFMLISNITSESPTDSQGRCPWSSQRCSVSNITWYTFLSSLVLQVALSLSSAACLWSSVRISEVTQQPLKTVWLSRSSVA